MAGYLRNPKWSASRLGAWAEPRRSVECEAPVKFIHPNGITSQPPAYFQFQSKEFRHRVKLCIHQDEQLLYSEYFPKLIVNEFMKFSSAWVSKVDFNGNVIKLSIKEK